MNDLTTSLRLEPDRCEDCGEPFAQALYSKIGGSDVTLNDDGSYEEEEYIDYRHSEPEPVTPPDGDRLYAYTCRQGHITYASLV